MIAVDVIRHIQMDYIVKYVKTFVIRHFGRVVKAKD